MCLKGFVNVGIGKYKRYRNVLYFSPVHSDIEELEQMLKLQAKLTTRVHTDSTGKNGSLEQSMHCTCLPMLEEIMYLCFPEIDLLGDSTAEKAVMQIKFIFARQHFFT